MFEVPLLHATLEATYKDEFSRMALEDYVSDLFLYSFSHEGTHIDRTRMFRRCSSRSCSTLPPKSPRPLYSP